MFKKYAIEPNLVVDWMNNPLRREMYRGAFGPGNGRLVGKFPARWAEQVLETCPDNPPMLRSRVVEYLSALGDALFDTNMPYDERRVWVENAATVQPRALFDAILARSPHAGSPDVVDAWSGFPPETVWRVPSTLPLRRTGATIAAALEPALSRATDIILVDPMLQADEARYRDFLLALLRTAVGGRSPSALTRVHYFCRPKLEWTAFDTCCRSLLPAAVPRGVTLQVIKIEGVTGGEWIHDRFILTNRGGWQLQSGLDEAPGGATSDLGTLSIESFTRRWADYAVSVPFRETGRITVHGSA